MGKWWKQWQRLFCGTPKISVDSVFSHKSKRGLILGRKAMTNLESVLKTRDITLPAKFHMVKAIDFPGVMFRCESCIIKMTEPWIIDAFELLRIPWAAWRSNHSILKKINPEYSLEVLMLKLKYLATWCEEPIHWKSILFWEWLKAEERDNQILKWLNGIID